MTLPIFVDSANKYGVAMNDLRVRKDIQLDLETTGLDPRQDSVLLVGIDEYVFPTYLSGKPTYFMKGLADLIEDPKIRKHNFNWAFDGMFWQAKGIRPVNLRDPMLGAILLKVGLLFEKGTFTLGNLLEKCLGVAHDKSLQTSFIGADPATFVPTREQIEYLYRDVKDLKRLSDWVEERLEDEGLIKTYQLECAYSQCIAEMQLQGLWVDVDEYRPVVSQNVARLEDITRQLQEKLTPPVMEIRLRDFEAKRVVRETWETEYSQVTAAIEHELDTNAPNLTKAERRKKIQEAQREWKERNPRPDLPKLSQEPININSDKQLLGALGELGLELENGQKDTLIRSKLTAPADLHPVIDLLVEHSEVGKLVSNYGEGLLAAIEDDGRIRSRYQQILNTGRISSSKWKDDARGVEKGTNLQNGHAEFKKCVKPEDGNAYVIFDLAAIELRVLADYVVAHNPQTQDAIPTALLAGQDPHSLTVTRVFGTPYDAVEAGKDDDPVISRNRKACKTTNFSAVFDIGPSTLAMRIHAATEDQRPLGEVQVQEAKKFLEGMWRANPDAAELLKGFEEFALRNAYAETLGGRRRHFTLVQPHTPQYHSLVGAIRRAARNVPIQGTAADVLKLAQVLIQRRLWRANIGWFLANAVHDEIVTEGPEEHAEQAKDIVYQAMKEAYEHYLKHIPFKASGGIQHVWKH